VAWIDVVADSAPQQKKSVTAVNAFSTVVPLIVGATGVMFKLVLDNDAAIKSQRTGRARQGKGPAHSPIKPTDRFELRKMGHAVAKSSRDNSAIRSMQRKREPTALVGAGAGNSQPSSTRPGRGFRVELCEF